MHSHEEFQKAVLAAESITELKETLSSYARFLGSDHYVYAAMTQVPITAPDVFAITNYSAEWMERYTARGYFDIDPVIQHSAKSLRPAFWNELDTLTPEAEAMMADAAEHGLGSGVTVPLYSPSGIFAVVSICASKVNDAVFYSRLKDAYPSIHLFCVYLHEVAENLINAGLFLQNKNILTVREKQCLMWSAEGKTAFEISKIIDISERTVVFHLNNAAKKLGANNKQQAIAKAIATGQIRSSKNVEQTMFSYNELH